ncbi:MAG: DUF503 domain-containing protein [Kineosporiaceae bacterium]
MFVAALTVDVLVPDSRSRKDKRSVVRSLVAELTRTGVSAAETGHLDLLRRSEVAIAVVSSTARHAGEVLDSCERTIRARPEIEVIAVERRLWKGSDEPDDKSAGQWDDEEEVRHG